MILTNARLVLPETTLHGALAIAGGQIQDIGAPTQSGLDTEGDFLLPGLIDLHTDNLERQVMPRANARWPSRSALLSHDAQCAADGLADIHAFATAGTLKAEHVFAPALRTPGP